MRNALELNRRTFIGASVAFSATILASCAGPTYGNPDLFVRSGGVLLRKGGPNLQSLGGGSGGFSRANRQTWWRPEYSVDSFSRLDEIFAASTARAAGNASPWQRLAEEPPLRYSPPAHLGGGSFDIDGYLDRNQVTGLLIARGNTILVERYQYDRTDRMRFTSFSMAKTVVALLIGLAVEDGAIRSLDDPAERFVPALSGTEYGRTPLRFLLTMSSGVRFREEYDGADDSARLSRATFGGGTVGGAEAVRAFNERIWAPGERWYYSSAETYVLAMVARAAHGQSLSAVLQDRIWQPMGAEADATWLTDRSGLEIGYMGVNAVLRDYARLGLLMADGGRGGGRQILPQPWLAAMTQAAFSAGQIRRSFGYGYQTWTDPKRDGSFGLFGVRGQFIFVDPAKRLVMVNTAVRASPRDSRNAETFALWGAVRSATA
jgi:CubicO group peptidase (beta-lactamase class C family)